MGSAALASAAPYPGMAIRLSRKEVLKRKKKKRKEKNPVVLYPVFLAYVGVYVKRHLEIYYLEIIILSHYLLNTRHV